MTKRTLGGLGAMAAIVTLAACSSDPGSATRPSGMGGTAKTGPTNAVRMGTASSCSGQNVVRNWFPDTGGWRVENCTADPYIAGFGASRVPLLAPGLADTDVSHQHLMAQMSVLIPPGQAATLTIAYEKFCNEPVQEDGWRLAHLVGNEVQRNGGSGPDNLVPGTTDAGVEVTGRLMWGLEGDVCGGRPPSPPVGDPAPDPPARTPPTLTPPIVITPLPPIVDPVFPCGTFSFSDYSYISVDPIAGTATLTLTPKPEYVGLAIFFETYKVSGHYQPAPDGYVFPTPQYRVGFVRHVLVAGPQTLTIPSPTAADGYPAWQADWSCTEGPALLTNDNNFETLGDAHGNFPYQEQVSSN